MKVIYIPLRIPLNLRSIASMLAILTATILCCVSTGTDAWQTVVAKELTVDHNEAGVFTYEDVSTIRIGLERLDYQTCHQHQLHGWELCNGIQIAFSNCAVDANRPEQGYAYNSKLQQTFCASPQWAMAVTAFFMSIGVCIVGFSSLLLVFFRERAIGISSLVNFFALIAIILLQSKSSAASMTIVDEIGARIKNFGGSYQSGVDYSYWCAAISALLFFTSAVASLSLFFWEPEHNSDPEARSSKPPSAVTIELPSHAAVGARGQDVLAAGASQPGFIRLGAEPTDDVIELDDDEALQPAAIATTTSSNAGAAAPSPPTG